MDREFLVELTMANEKVYIGMVDEAGLNTSAAGDVAIIPFISGHRDKHKRLQLTTFYGQAMADFANDEASKLTMEDFKVVLPKDRIESARRFDLDVYVGAFQRSDHDAEAS